jgi:ectoine hydroxylase-related dioxygenase (phytanoyl-CoA dioxygenase family)
LKFFQRKTAASDLADFHRDGFMLIRNALPTNVVADAAASFARMSAEIAEGTNPLKRADRFVSGGSLPAELDAIPRHPALISLATQVIGPDVAMYMNRLLVKDQTWNGPVAAHQDCPYFHGTTEKLSIFVPLEPFTEQTGNLKFVAGSHRYGNLGVRGTIRYEEFPQLPIVAPEAQPGDIILATFTVWHFSEAAVIACERPLLQIAYQNAADGSYFGEPDEPRLVSGQWRTESFNRYRDHVTPDG